MTTSVHSNLAVKYTQQIEAAITTIGLNIDQLLHTANQIDSIGRAEITMSAAIIPRPRRNSAPAAIPSTTGNSIPLCNFPFKTKIIVVDPTLDIPVTTQIAQKFDVRKFFLKQKQFYPGACIQAIISINLFNLNNSLIYKINFNVKAASNSRLNI